MRIALVVPSLTSGGAERVVQVLSGALSSAGYAVTVITTTTREDFYVLPRRVDRVSLDVTGAAPGQALNRRAVMRTVWTLPRSLRRLRSTLLSGEFAVVIGFMEHANILCLAAVGRRLPVVVTEHTDPAYRSIGLIARMLRRFTYPTAAYLVSVSAGVDSGFSWLPRRARRIIHNPLPQGVFEKTPSQGSDSGSAHSPFIAAMGRLTHEKGFDLLIEAFGRVSALHPNWRLVVIGEGEDKAMLEEQVRSLGLTDRIRLPGRLADPFPLLRQAEFFVLSSRYEGFGNVIAEALACGLPVVSFDCPSGPSEIIEDEVSGLLVPPGNVDQLAERMQKLMSDKRLRQRLASNATRSVSGYSAEAIVQKWETEVLRPISGR